jgi:hypothetical protein
MRSGTGISLRINAVTLGLVCNIEAVVPVVPQIPQLNAFAFDLRYFLALA